VAFKASERGGARGGANYESKGWPLALVSYSVGVSYEDYFLGAEGKKRKLRNRDLSRAKQKRRGACQRGRFSTEVVAGDGKTTERSKEK